ncbi:hypothetical protein EJ069_18445 [Mesorhizobium sp. M2A.F.Ca.ET.043.05.1.1]|uniref:autotransporter domain-containing protein n=1 Tax=Mesorhizobium sp. M2A.F.Ca.ET.043.05.1.1 TaxID=2493671 RepID=UPI000F755E97|nr:autotransporter domain-containing protein [Mesorhizobium sp. M2A.F.Ca.ET.043.05.1.1]AZO16519.1 hypothetical protein EJ069_18445 [Mesorhizobium sp. M2A.F.Ca.ET.043.05.1.1]
MAATACGFLGWRHAFGDTAPTIGVAFAGQDPFTIAGTPIARDAALIDLGLDARPARPRGSASAISGNSAAARPTKPSRPGCMSPSKTQ